MEENSYRSTGPPIRIRRATHADRTLLADLGARTFSAAFGPDNRPEDMAAYLAQAFSPEIQSEELADPLSTFLIAENEDEVVGYTRLLRGPAPSAVEADRPVELVRIYAEPSWIGRGVGSALMGACLKEGGKQGCDVIWLGVWERNRRAIAFYERWGFAVVGSQTFVLGKDRQTDRILVRQLPEP